MRFPTWLSLLTLILPLALFGACGSSSSEANDDDNPPMPNDDDDLVDDDDLPANDDDDDPVDDDDIANDDDDDEPASFPELEVTTLEPEAAAALVERLAEEWRLQAFLFSVGDPCSEFGRVFSEPRLTKTVAQEAVTVNGGEPEQCRNHYIGRYDDSVFAYNACPLNGYDYWGAMRIQFEESEEQLLGNVEFERLNVGWFEFEGTAALVQSWVDGSYQTVLRHTRTLDSLFNGYAKLYSAAQNEFALLVELNRHHMPEGTKDTWSYAGTLHLDKPTWVLEVDSALWCPYESSCATMDLDLTLAPACVYPTTGTALVEYGDGAKLGVSFDCTEYTVHYPR